MASIVLFATSRTDAVNYCNENNLDFDSVVWVLNPQLLGGIEVDTSEVYYTDTFRQMPVFREAEAFVKGDGNE